MSEYPKEICEGILDAIGADAPVQDDEQIQAMITKCVVIVEWVDHQGHRWLTRRTMLGDGSPGSAWDASGLLYEALHGDWQKENE